MTGELFQGLNALRDEWQLTTTATESNSGVQVALRRRFFNNRIPIFQFGIFYDDDLEFHPGPRFDFGGQSSRQRQYVYDGADRTLFFIESYGKRSYFHRRCKKRFALDDLGSECVYQKCFGKLCSVESRYGQRSAKSAKRNAYRPIIPIIRQPITALIGKATKINFREICSPIRKRLDLPIKNKQQYQRHIARLFRTNQTRQRSRKSLQ